MTQVVVLAHVLAAFAYVSGYVATNVLTELARRAEDPAGRATAIRYSTTFDRALNAPFGTLTGVSGLLLLFLEGRSLTTPWIVASTVLFVAIVVLGIVYWARRGALVSQAIAAGDDAGARRLLSEPRAMLVSRAENGALLTILVLMVLRPG